MKQVPSLSRSDSLGPVARRAWESALSDFYYPPLPDIHVEHSNDASSYFYIETDDWTVHLNTAGVPPHLDMNEAEPYLRSVCHHEIQHYLLCPYDAVMNGMMLAGARRHINDATAFFVCNLFADLVVDSALLKRYTRVTYSRIISNIYGSSMMGQAHSSLWLLIVSCYRAMWGFPLPSTVSIDKETYQAAEAIIRVSRKYIDNENRWPKAVEEIAKIVAEWQPDAEEPLAGCGGTAEPAAAADTGSILVPPDVDAVMGNPVEIRNGDRARSCMPDADDQDLEKEMERLAVEVEQRGGNLGDLESVYLVAGIDSKRKQWIRFWYRAKARGLLRFDVRGRKLAGNTPLSIQTWRLGDPLEELDVVQSLQAFPFLVPNMSTRRWLKTEMYGDLESDSLPDLLLVIDSSGSMAWSMRKANASGPYHVALVSAFASIDAALRKGAKVAVVNFSDGTRECDWTKNRRDLERVLLVYQGGGTVAPVKQIEEACDRAGSGVMVLMITDAEVANWDRLVKSIDKLTIRSHKYFIFHVEQNGYSLSKKACAGLENAGASVISVESINALPGLVIREVQSIYGF
ncbi:MAG: hypothetical protein ACFFEA_08210 [Candidatus Thorarchaeota archaeon]